MKCARNERRANDVQLRKVIAVAQEIDSIKPRERPAFDNVVVGHKSKGPECRSVISTVIISITPEAMDATQGERDTQLHL